MIESIFTILVPFLVTFQFYYFHSPPSISVARAKCSNEKDMLKQHLCIINRTKFDINFLWIILSTYLISTIFILSYHFLYNSISFCCIINWQVYKISRKSTPRRRESLIVAVDTIFLCRSFFVVMFSNNFQNYHFLCQYYQHYKKCRLKRWWSSKHGHKTLEALNIISFKPVVTVL